MQPILKRILRPIEIFVAMEAASGILLAVCTLLALLLANSPWQEHYHHLLHEPVAGLSIHAWINDGLMTIFFFVVGMEIKRELVRGELSSPKRAALPIAAAIGGMIGPALIYYAFNPVYPNVKGWGIPMATDIAFAVGVLSFFGRRVPFPLKVFLLALAIVDDLGAVLVIAFFYTKEIAGPALALAAGAMGIMVLVRRMGIRSYYVYSALGILAWYGVLRSGIHATVAGVLIGFLTPLDFPAGKKKSYSPLDELVAKLHPWVSYGIMPVFALSNAGVTLGGEDFWHLIHSPIHQGVALGLLLGKPIGILLASVTVVLAGLAQLPSGVRWPEIAGVGFLGGIGFTMALFISNLALYPEQEIFSKTGILGGSLLSMILGSLVLLFAFRLQNVSGGD